VRIIERQHRLGRDKFTSYDIVLESEDEEETKLFSRRSELVTDARTSTSILCIHAKTRSISLET
jgi:hypothetical protein